MKLMLLAAYVLSAASLACAKPVATKALGSKMQRGILLVSPESTGKVFLMKDFFPLFVNSDGDLPVENKRRSIMSFIPSVQTIAAFNDLNTAAAKTWTAASATAAPASATASDAAPSASLITNGGGSFSGFVPDVATIAALNDLNKINLDSWMPPAAPADPAPLPSETSDASAPQIRQLFM